MQQAIQQLVTLAQAIGKPIDHQGLTAPISLLPAGVAIHSLEHLLPNPTRTRQKLTVLDAESFIAYVNRFALSLIHISEPTRPY